jgi:predicted  nucleic acid-binding Zn-ribbon protein
MERLMNKSETFVAANRELSAFLVRVDRLAAGSGDLNARDLQALSNRIAVVGPELCSASQVESVDTALQHEIVRYIANLRSLQTALEKVSCIMLARKHQIEADRQHLLAVQGWVAAYHQTRDWH